MQTAPPKPEKVFRYGFLAANVFVNEIEEGGQKRQVRIVELQKTYREDDQWKLTSALTMVDLPAAIRLLQLAQEHVESFEVEVFDGTDASSEEGD